PTEPRRRRPTGSGGRSTPAVSRSATINSCRGARPGTTPAETLPVKKQPKRTRSQEAYRRACEVIPGGVNSPARAFRGVGGDPIFVERGEGPYLFDLEGNRYLDYVGSWGPLILGHAHPRVVKAVEEALHRGATFGAPTELETELAELIVEVVPSI